MQSKVIAKTVLFNDTGQVLLLRRSLTDDRRPGEQDFPGGGVEPDEVLNDALAREVAEETGLLIAPKALTLFYAATELYQETDTYPAESVTRLLFVAEVKRPEIKLSFEHDQYSWVSPEIAVNEFPHPFYGAGLAYIVKHKLFVS